VPETPKSAAGRRTVSFPAELVPELRWHLDRFAALGERGLVFTGPKGAALRRSNFRPIWNAGTAKAGSQDSTFTTCDMSAGRWPRLRVPVSRS
jgi:hypothetical protein